MGRWPISRGLMLKVAPTVLRIYSREMLRRAKTIVPSKLAMVLLFSAATSCHGDDGIDDLQTSMNPEQQKETLPADAAGTGNAGTIGAPAINAFRESGKQF